MSGLLELCINDKIHNIKEFFSKNKDISETDVIDSMIYICKNDRCECLEIFYGINVTYLNMLLYCGLTPFLIACKYNSRRCITFFIKNGFLSGRKDAKTTALMIACDQRNISLIILLLKIGVNINEYNSKNETALIFSCSTGNDTATRVLIRSGAKLNLRDSYGMTALIHAVVANNSKCVKLLLEAGALISKVDNAGNNASAVANNMMHHDISNILKEHIKNRIGKYCKIR